MRSLGQLQPSPGRSSNIMVPLSWVFGQVGGGGGQSPSAWSWSSSSGVSWEFVRNVEFQVYPRASEPASAVLPDPQVNWGRITSEKSLVED